MKAFFIFKERSRTNTKAKRKSQKKSVFDKSDENLEVRTSSMQ